LEEDRLCLYYRKIVPIRAPHAESKHFEVLLRLIDEAGNVVTPGELLPAATHPARSIFPARV